jgi:uncharacterized protein YecT (DUF1311 family)
MSRLILTFLIAFFSISSYAQNCENQPNMAAVRACAEMQSGSSFESRYEVLMNVLKNKKLNDAANSLKQSQAAWLEYRNTTCRYMYHIAASSDDGYPRDFETNCVIDFNTGREKILSRYIKLCEKNKSSCDIK